MVCGGYIIIERYLGIRKTNIEPGSTLSLKEITPHEYYSNYIHPLHMGAQVIKDQFRFIANIPQCFFGNSPSESGNLDLFFCHKDLLTLGDHRVISAFSGHFNACAHIYKYMVYMYNFYMNILCNYMCMCVVYTSICSLGTSIDITINLWISSLLPPWTRFQVSCIFLLRTEAKGCRFLVPGLALISMGIQIFTNFPCPYHTQGMKRHLDHDYL